MNIHNFFFKLKIKTGDWILLLILKRIVLYNSAYCEQDSNLQPSAVGRKVKVFFLFIANTSTINFGDTNILLIFFFWIEFTEISLRSLPSYLFHCYNYKNIRNFKVVKNISACLHLSPKLCKPTCTLKQAAKTKKNEFKKFTLAALSLLLLGTSEL